MPIAQCNQPTPWNGSGSVIRQTLTSEEAGISFSSCPEFAKYRRYLTNSMPTAPTRIKLMPASHRYPFTVPDLFKYVSGLESTRQR